MAAVMPARVGLTVELIVRKALGTHHCRKRKCCYPPPFTKEERDSSAEIFFFRSNGPLAVEVESHKLLQEIFAHSWQVKGELALKADARIEKQQFSSPSCAELIVFGETKSRSNG